MSSTDEADLLTRSQRAAANRLGVQVLGGSRLAVDVACPFCGGTRTVRPSSLYNWATKGKVPTCEAVRRMNVGTHCRPLTQGGN